MSLRLLSHRWADAFVARAATHRTCTEVTSRWFASKSDAPKFDELMAKAYTQISENHRHELGPWGIMTHHVVSHVKDLESPSILDLATGPGEPAKSIAMALPHAAVFATDVSEDMIAAATEKLGHLENAKCILADAQDLSVFDSESMDVVTCCYGYMFPSDKAASLSETHRVLKPGGILVATTWDHLDMMNLNRDIMRDITGKVPQPPPLNPMSLSEEGLFRKFVEDAGFAEVTQTTSTYPFSYGSCKDFQFTMGTLLLRNAIDEMAKEDEHVWKRAHEAFWSNVVNYSTVDENGDLIVSKNTFRLTVARKG